MTNTSITQVPDIKQIAEQMANHLRQIPKDKFSARLMKTAQLLMMAKMTLGRKLTSEELLSKKVIDFKRALKLRCRDFLPHVEKLTAALGLSDTDYLYKTRDSSASSKGPASRMSLWRMFHKIGDGLLVKLRKTAMQLDKKIEQTQAIPLSVKPVAAASTQQIKASAPSVATNVTVPKASVAVTPRDLLTESKANATWTGKGLYNRR